MEKSTRPTKKTKKHTKKWITKTRRLALYIRDGFQCAYCGSDLSNVVPNEITLDHLQARSFGGGNKNQNLVTACKSCNSRRGNKPWVDYATGGAVERINTLRNLPVNVVLARAIIDGTAGDPEVEAQR